MVDYSPYIDGLKRREAARKAWLEKRRQRACLVAQRIAEMLRRDFGATTIYQFGSTLRASGFHAHSDIDLAAEGIPSEQYFAAIGQALMMSDEFSVDLLEISSCQPELKDIILKEGIILWPSKYLLLQEKIAEECSKLDKLVQKILTARHKHGTNEIFVDFAAVNLQAYYTGIERIFRTIAEKIDDSIPESERWHKDLLDQVAIEVPQMRPSVISKSMRDELFDYLAFRHVIRNVYPFDINAKKVEELLDKLQHVHEQLTRELEAFREFLRQTSSSV